MLLYFSLHRFYYISPTHHEKKNRRNLRPYEINPSEKEYTRVLKHRIKQTNDFSTYFFVVIFLPSFHQNNLKSNCMQRNVSSSP